MNWNITVIIICTLLAALAGYKEFTRPKRTYALLRVIAAITAAIALACIALPIQYNGDSIQKDDHEAILITPGYNTDTLNGYKTQKLYTLHPGIKRSISNAVLLKGPEDLTADSSITEIHILGDGLNKDQLEQLNGLPVRFYPSKKVQGITAVNWNDRLKAGDELTVQGTYNNSATGKVKLLLKGLSTTLDSVTAGAGENGVFQLNAIPKTTGKSVYNLLAISETDTLEQESVPIQVEAIKPLKILMVTAAPDFESRFLKNWLAQNGYAVAVRSAISKDKFNQEFINLEQLPVGHLSASLLDKFDVVIGDLSVLKSLTGSEAAVLKQQVTQKGLGVIIRADSTSHSASWLQNDFTLDRLAIKDAAPVSLSLQGSDVKTAPLNAGPAYINSKADIQALVNDNHEHILAAAALKGAGHLVFTPLGNTFSWTLAGNKKDYARLWSLLIKEAARKSPIESSLSVASAIPAPLNPLMLQLKSAAAISTIDLNNSAVSPGQQSALPFIWDITGWPASGGWQSVKPGDGTSASFFVYGENEWANIRALKKQADTKDYISKNHLHSSVTKQIHKKATITVSKIYFYVLLLIACMFLWVEAKFL